MTLLSHEEAPARGVLLVYVSGSLFINLIDSAQPSLMAAQPVIVNRKIAIELIFSLDEKQLRLD